MHDPAEMNKLYRRFWRAARRGNAAEVLAIISGHPELHGYAGEAGTLVEILCRDAPTLLEPGLALGLSPDAVSSGGNTPLEDATANGDLDRMRLLLRHGASTELRNSSGEVALGFACSWGQIEAARLLVEAGADLNAIEADPETGYRNTALDCCGRFPETRGIPPQLGRANSLGAGGASRRLTRPGIPRGGSG